MKRWRMWVAGGKLEVKEGGLTADGEGEGEGEGLGFCDWCKDVNDVGR